VESRSTESSPPTRFLRRERLDFRFWKRERIFVLYSWLILLSETFCLNISVSRDFVTERMWVDATD
jgi:hypothetical protein